jgi:ATP synthase protein I
MTTERPAPTPSFRVSGVRPALAVTVVVGLAAALAALVFGGRPQLVGVLAGAGLVVAFFLFGALSTSVVAALAPRISLVVALLTYTLQVVLLALVLVVVQRSDAGGRTLDVSWLAGTVIVATLCWTAALVTDALRSTDRSTEHVTSAGEVRG